jgi:hypothetical protein
VIGSVIFWSAVIVVVVVTVTVLATRMDPPEVSLPFDEPVDKSYRNTTTMTP